MKTISDPHEREVSAPGEPSHAAASVVGSGKWCPPGMKVHLLRTSWGVLGLGTIDDVLCRVVLPCHDAESVLAQLGPGPELVRSERLKGSCAAAADCLVAYFDGKPVDPADTEAALDLGRVTPFMRRVYEELRQVKRGSVVSYGELAARAGAPRAARAVGMTMARNRLPLLVPCHRVVGAARSLRGFSAPGGVDVKAHLLRLEGVTLPRLLGEAVA